MAAGGAGAHPRPCMEHDPQRPTLPAIPAPPAFAERRRAFRRAEDLSVHEERALLARALDVLAGPGDAATQVAEILALVARVVGARRAALVTDRPSAASSSPRHPARIPRDARALAAWLDARALPARRRAGRRRAGRGHRRPGASRTRPGERTGAPRPGRLADRLVRLEASAAARRSQLGLELAEPGATRATVGGPPAGRDAAPPPRGPRRGERRGRPTRRSARDLRARERERERFVSMVAHELRTPLTGLGGYLDLLADGAVDDPEIGREFIERSRGIVERMAALVGDLLELSRIEAGSLRLEIEPVSLAEACERAIAPLGPIAAGRGDPPGRRPSAPDPDRPGRPAPRRADRDQPRRPTPASSRPRGASSRSIARVEGPAGARRRARRRAGHRAGRPRAGLPAVRPARRPRARARDGARPADQPRPRPGDGRRPRRRVRAGQRLGVRRRPADRAPTSPRAVVAAAIADGRRARGDRARGAGRAAGTPRRRPGGARAAAADGERAGRDLRGPPGPTRPDAGRVDAA